MDYTLIGLTGTLRPLVTETFEQLIDDGHTLYIWSGLGNRSSEVEKLVKIKLESQKLPKYSKKLKINKQINI